MLEFNVRLELKDYIRLNIFHGRKNVIIMLFLGWFAVTMMSIGRPLNIKIFCYIYFTILYLLFHFIYLKYNSKKIYESDKLIQQEMHYIVSENEITQETENSKNKILTSDILKVCEDKYSIYIYISKIRILLIPKRCISLNEQEKLKNLLKV